MGESQADARLKLGRLNRYEEGPPTPTPSFYRKFCQPQAPYRP